MQSDNNTSFPIISSRQPAPESVVKPSRKNLYIVLPVIFLLLVLSITSFLFYRKKSTTEWKTYSNNSLNLSYRIPPDWKTIHNDSNTGCTSSPKYHEDGDKNITYGIIICSSLFGVEPPLEDFLTGYCNGTGSIKGIGENTCNKGKLNQFESINVERTDKNGFLFKEYILTESNIDIWSLYDPNNKTDKETVSQILSTLIFISPNDQISSWKTYTNTEYSIKYPTEGFVVCGQENFALFEGTNQDDCTAGEQETFILITNSLQGTGDDKSTNENCYSVQKEQIKFSGIDASKYSSIIKNETGDCTWLSAKARNTKDIVFNYNGKVYNIVYADNQKAELKNQILSTFKFTNTQSGLPEVPAYPQAKFIKKEFIAPCPEEPAVCNVDSYTWETSEGLNKVIAWYEQDQSKSGWKLTGGTGSEETSRSGNFSNGKITYWLTIYNIDPKGERVGIALRGPLETIKIYYIPELKIYITLPFGWTKNIVLVKDEFPEGTNDKHYELVLTNGDYSMEIGDQVGGGRADCSDKNNVVLNNSSLSSKVERQWDTICSNLDNDDLDYGTKIGKINYTIPKNYDEKVLKEMDSIVESIKVDK